MEEKVVGKPVIRARIIDKVTGVQKYAGDRKVFGMLYARILRSEHAKARILHVDAADALNMEGVVSVLTGGNLPDPVPRFGSVECDQPILAYKEVKYHGEPVAVVVAVCDEIACEALTKIKVSYEDLPAVCTVESALKEDAPLVREPDSRYGDSVKNSNIYKQWDFSWGDTDKAEEKCAWTLHNTYQYPMVYHFSIENYSCIAEPEEDGVVIWTPIQHPYILRRVVAGCLKIPFSKVRVIAEEIGGAFGGKGYPKTEPLAAYLAMRMRKPVKIQLSMEEGFFSARRTSARVEITTGFDSKGCIAFQKINADYLMGAYVDAAPRVIQKASYLCCGPYATPNMKMTSRAIYSNTVPGTAFRGFGMPQLVWALESQMNEAVAHFGLDAVEIRRRNLPHRGETLIPGDIPVDGDWHEVLNKTAELLAWGKKSKENQGKGIAIGIKSGIHSSTSNAIVRLHSDGSATVCAGTTEMGQGARTVLGQIAAEVLGLPCESVAIILGDTGPAPFDFSTAGSRSTVCMGTAVANACKDILEQLQLMAVKMYRADQNKVTADDGQIIVEGRKLTYQDVIEEYFGVNQGDVTGKGCFRGDRIKGHPLGGKADFWEFIIMGAAVELDVKTGKVIVDKLVCVSDTGKVINYPQSEGQEEGGSVMGLGQALMESMVYSEKGLLLNGNPLDYCIPTIKDIPVEMISCFIENQDGPGPFGSKGLGESSAIPVGPVIAGAIFDASGILIRELPITAEKLYFALKNTAD